MKLSFLLLALSLSPLAAHKHHKPQPAASETAVEKPQPRNALEWIAIGNKQMQEARDVLSHDFTEAEKSYQQALALEPSNPRALVGMAWVANSNHDFKAGKSWCESALALDPTLHDAHNLLGDGAVELGEYDAAFDHYQSALDLRADLSTYARASHLLWLTGNTRTAQSLMRKAIAAGGPYPENTAWCHAELAIQLIHAGAFPAARQELDHALKLAPSNPRVLIAQGRLASSQADYPTAIAAFEKSAAVTPTHDALAPLVDLFAITDAPDKAKAQTRKVIAFHEHSHGREHGKNHSHPGSHQLAIFLADQGTDPAAALVQARSAHEHFPNLASEDALAWAYFKSGKFPEARRHLLRALAKDTPDPMLHFHAGMIFEKLGETSASRRHLAQALNLNPGFHPTHALTARALLATEHKP